MEYPFLKPIRYSESGAVLKAGPSGEPGPDSRNRIIQALNDFMTTFNAEDPGKHRETLRFPHFRLASKKLNLHRVGSEYMNIPFFFLLFRVTTGFKWHHSKWNHLKIVQTSDDKVHVVTRFSRCKSDNSVFATIDSLYILNRKNGRWKILGRSSFAPM